MNKRQKKKNGIHTPTPKIRKMFPKAFAFVDALKQAGYPMNFEYYKKDGFSDRKFFCKTEPYCWFGYHLKGRVSYQVVAILNDIHHPLMDNRIVIENERCFDKWTRCPISLPIPTNEAQFSYVLEKLEELGTEEWYNRSNKYDYRNGGAGKPLPLGGG